MSSALSEVVAFLKEMHEIEAARNLLHTYEKYGHNLLHFDELGKLFFDVKEYGKSLKYAHKALVNSPDNQSMYNARANLSKIYNQTNYPEKALFYSKINQRFTPNDYDIKLEQVMSYFLLNEKKQSEQILQDLLNDPNLPENVRDRVEFNLGTYDLYRGDFQQGLKRFLLTGKKLGLWYKKYDLEFKFWDGVIQPGKSILIISEGGIGDEFISIRFLKKFEELGMKPIWFSNNKLDKIFSRCGFPSIRENKDIPKDALWTYGMSTPVYLNLTVNDLWSGPYITPDDEYKKKWSWMKQSGDKIRVGIRWSGNPMHEHDLHRTVPLDKMYESLKDKGYEIYSLQKGDGEHDCDKYPDVIKLCDKIQDYDDTLAIIDNLDFVVSSCTSVVHASASMGKKTLVILPISAYYTWSHPTEQSPWYGDNVKLFRQQKPREWDEPFKLLNEELTKSDYHSHK